MANKQTRGTIRQRGFSLLELLIVVAIIVAVSAFAIPKFQDALADIRLRANANSLSSLLQQARMQAVKTNTACTARSNGSIVSVFNAAGAAVGGPAVAITSETSL